MKKIVLWCMGAFVLALGVSSFTNDELSTQRTIFEKLFSTTTNIVSESPSGTVYGIVDKTPEAYVVNTPLGKYNVHKHDGGFSFLGLWAKIESKKGSNYIVDSNIGKFKVNFKKCTITKL